MHSDGQHTSTLFDWVSERHLRLRRKPTAHHDWIRSAAFALQTAKHAAVLSDVISITPSFSSILIEFDIAQLDANVIDRVLQITAEINSEYDSALELPTLEIPVCYDPASAPDIQSVARMHDITEAELASMHSQAQYTVRFIGFAPGFPYLDGLPTELSTPRLPTPRVRVPAGSVGIAGTQTGIYPFETAGGWQLIGQTPLKLFDAKNKNPALLQPGMRVRFISIPLNEFKSMTRGNNG